MKKYDRRKIILGIAASAILIIAAIVFLVFYTQNRQEQLSEEPEVVDEVVIEDVEVNEVEVDDAEIIGETVVPESDEPVPHAGPSVGAEIPAAGPSIAEPSAKSLFE